MLQQREPHMNASEIPTCTTELNADSHLAQLCASATVTGVSVVGYAIGTTDSPNEAVTSSPSPGGGRAKLLAVYTRPQHPEAPIGGVFDSSPPHSYASSTLRSQYLQTPRQTSGERSQNRKSLRRSTTGGSLGHQRSLDLDRAMKAVAEEGTVETRPQLHSRSSWAKRLSTISLSGASTPSTGLSRPASAALSFSAGSTNFSRAGSTVPMFGAPAQQQPLPPNKLVKRSSSVRTVNGIPTPEGSSSRFGRPLTSHDRIRTQRARPASSYGALDWSAMNAFAVREERYTPQWRHYFTAKAARSATDPDASHGVTSKSGKTLKRLFPDDSYHPVLVMAESIVATAVDVDETFRYSADAESMLFGGSSRPMTPAGILSSSVDRQSPSTAPFKRSRPEPALTAPAVDEGKPRRSFSIGDLLSRAPSSAKPAKHRSFSGSFGDRFLRRRGLRVSSAPMRLMAEPKQSIELQHDRERPAKRRESESQCSSQPPPSSGSHQSSDYRFPASSPLSPSLSKPSPTLRHGNAFGTVDESSAIAEEDSAMMVDDGAQAALRMPSALRQSRHRVRHSVTHSEQASTIGGSDNETRGMSSGDDDDTDMTSDTMFDSIRTRATRSTSGAGARGPRIETIFDESPPHKSTQPFLGHLHHEGGGAHIQNDVMTDLDIEARSWPDTEAAATPKGKAGLAVPPAAVTPLTPPAPAVATTLDAPFSSPHFNSSPPNLEDHHDLRQPRLHLDTRQDASDEDMWDVDDSASDRLDGVSDTAAEDYERVATPLSIHRSNPMLVDTSSSSAAHTPVNLVVEQPQQASNRDSIVSKSSVFDWSEPAETSTGSTTPPRPKTVHGKKQPGQRGSRAAGRRAPSGMHVRSQSVPVVPDLAGGRGKDNGTGGAKFGTWNASKPPTEDWEDDFDFGDPLPQATAAASSSSKDDGGETHEGGLDEKRVDSGFGMLIPKSIRDQQGSMQQNRKLLTDMYHYAGALRDLQRHAVRLEMLGDDGNNENVELFKLVDAIIALADEESEELEPGDFSPPSSPSFDPAAFEEDATPGNKHHAAIERIGKGRQVSSSSAPPAAPSSSTTAQAAGKLRRRSVLPPNDTLIFAPHSPHRPASTDPPIEQDANNTSPSPSPARTQAPTTPVKRSSRVTRPRKDSVARAKLVIERFQDRNTQANAAALDGLPLGGGEKMAFDTATLRNLVPFVKEVVDAAKAAVRERERLCGFSPEASPHALPSHRAQQQHYSATAEQQPDFTSVFTNKAVAGSPTTPRASRRAAANNRASIEREVGDELAQQLRMMAVV